MCIRDRDNHVGLGDTLETELPALVLPVQPDTAEIIRVILDLELLVGIQAAPFMIRNARGGINLSLIHI